MPSGSTPRALPQGGEFQVNTFTPSGQSFPAVAMDADGDFVVAWNSTARTATFGIFARRFNAAGVARA